MRRFLFCSAAAITLILAVSLSASASTLLTTTIAMDDGYQIGISTSNTVEGTMYGQYWGWYEYQVRTLSFWLEPGTDYYIHIRGVDAYAGHGTAGLLGEFTLSGTDHQFSNGGTTLYTDTTHWYGNNWAGWAGPYDPSLTDEGANGVAPWGFVAAISPNAHWIWAGEAYEQGQAHFITKISATATEVPEPTSLLLLGSGIAGIGLATWICQKQTPRINVGRHPHGV